MNTVTENRKEMIYAPSINDLEVYNSCNLYQQIEQDLETQFSSSRDITSVIKRIMILTKVEIKEKNKESYTILENYINNFLDKHYNITLKQFDNWWDFQIGIPLILIDIVILLDEYLTFQTKKSCFQAIKHFINFDSNNTGANLLDKSFAIFIISNYEEDNNTQEAMINNLNKVYAFVDSGDGFYEDGGFIQHYNIPYLGAYGQVLLERTRDFVYVIKDKKLINKVDKSQILKILKENVLKNIFNGAIPDLTLGRSCSRENNNSSKQGLFILTSVLIILESFNEDDVDFVLEQIKINQYFETKEEELSFFEQNYIHKYFEKNKLSSYQQNKFNKFTPSVEQVMHVRDSFALYVGLVSNRISSFEYGNGENKQGWYSHAGSSWLVLKGVENFSNNFYASMNMLQFPGTTTDYIKGELHPWYGYYNNGGYVGGVSDGKNGFSSMKLEMKDITKSELVSHKSYFQIDNTLYFLGSRINKKESETIIENRQVDNCKIFVDGNQIKLGDNILCENLVELYYGGHFIQYKNFSDYQWNVEYTECMGTYRLINENGSTREYVGKYLIIKQAHINSSEYCYSLSINENVPKVSLCSNSNLHMVDNGKIAMYATLGSVFLKNFSTTYCLLLQINQNSKKMYIANPIADQKSVEFVYENKTYLIDFEKIGRNVVCVDKE